MMIRFEKISRSSRQEAVNSEGCVAKKKRRWAGFVSGNIYPSGDHLTSTRWESSAKVHITITNDFPVYG